MNQNLPFKLLAFKLLIFSEFTDFEFFDNLLLLVTFKVGVKLLRASINSKFALLFMYSCLFLWLLALLLVWLLVWFNLFVIDWLRWLFLLIDALLLLLLLFVVWLLLMQRTFVGATFKFGGWSRRLRSVTSSELKLLRRCCRWTASGVEDASEIWMKREKICCKRFVIFMWILVGMWNCRSIVL